jgi:hypothetical protein
MPYRLPTAPELIAGRSGTDEKCAPGWSLPT